MKRPTCLKKAPRIIGLLLVLGGCGTLQSLPEPPAHPGTIFPPIAKPTTPPLPIETPIPERQDWFEEPYSVPRRKRKRKDD